MKPSIGNSLPVVLFDEKIPVKENFNFSNVEQLIIKFQFIVKFFKKNQFYSCGLSRQLLGVSIPKGFCNLEIWYAQSRDPGTNPEDN